MTEVTMFKSLNSKVYNTQGEAEEADYEFKIDKIAASVDGWLENDYPNTKGILHEICIAIRNEFGKLTKADIQKLIEATIVEDVY